MEHVVVSIPDQEYESKTTTVPGKVNVQILLIDTYIFLSVGFGDTSGAMHSVSIYTIYTLNAVFSFGTDSKYTKKQNTISTFFFL